MSVGFRKCRLGLFLIRSTALTDIRVCESNSPESILMDFVVFRGSAFPPRAKTFLISICISHTVEDRAKLQRYMMKHGRDVAIQHIGNTADYPCFAKYQRDCPHARRIASRVLLLPTYRGYRPSEARKNVRLIRRFFDQAVSTRRLSDFETASSAV